MNEYEELGLELDKLFDLEDDTSSDNLMDLDTILSEVENNLEKEKVDFTFLENLVITEDFLEKSSISDDSFIDIDALLLTPEVPKTDIVLRRPLPMLDTINQYEPMFVRLATLVKDYDFNKKASDEISKRLIRFYDEHNDILPNVMLSKDIGGGSIQSYVIHKIRNRCSVKDILEILKKFFKENTIVTSGNNRFFISSENENRVILFLNEMHSFYLNDLATFEKENQKQSLILYDFGGEVGRLANLISAPDINFVYPNKIFLEKGTFICGECKKEVTYNAGFLKTALMNTSSENDFLSVYPTFEICNLCGNINVLPYNYFEAIATNLKANFKKEVDIKFIRDCLQKLSNFTVYPYEISRAAYYAALPNDLFNFFEKDQYDIIPECEEVEVKKMDVLKSTSDYLRLVSQLESGKRVVYEKSNITDTLYSLLARIFCFVFGVDYSTIKNNAIQSVLFFFEDFIPYNTKPSAILDFYALELAGIEKKEDFIKEYKEYVDVLTFLEKKKDYFCFIPITHYFVDCPSSKYLVYDKRLQKIVDYISDTMIIFHLKSDLIDTCKIGLSTPFLRNRASLLNVLNKPSRALIKQFNNSLNAAQPVILKDIMKFQENWITNNVLANSFIANLLKYFSNRDIYGFVKEVFSNSNKTAIFAKNLEVLREEVFCQSKLEFYYKDIFPDVDFSMYDDSGITIFFQYDSEEKDFASYLKVIKDGKSKDIKNVTIKYNDWFRENISVFFDVLINYVLCNVRQKDILFMDMMRYLFTYDLEFIVQIFGINNTMMEVALSSTSEYIYEEIDIELELVKRFLLIFPYTDSTLQILLAESESSNSDATIAMLLSEKELLAYEFSNSSEEIKKLLKKKFNIPL